MTHFAYKLAVSFQKVEWINDFDYSIEKNQVSGTGLQAFFQISLSMDRDHSDYYPNREW
jgi:hypothetical protein